MITANYEHGNKRFYAFGDKPVYVNGERAKGMVVELDESGSQVSMRTYNWETEEEKTARLKQQVDTICTVVGATIGIIGGTVIGLAGVACIAYGSIVSYDSLSDRLEQYSTQSTDDIVVQENLSRGPFIYEPAFSSISESEGKKGFVYSVLNGDTASGIATKFEQDYPECGKVDHNNIVNFKGEPVGNLIYPWQEVYVSVSCNI
ncbi:hypothetical protein COV16_00105 [Candidatus Woesearchaeota archaeon CG10_big_fil_rev_8_21_14_0_10_34_8]|nr:MAG: hypothetical protein COV16_00105 [Candidatus Woesearchaeota archaeon CG10_big_fil_rev_8_21_14_0_10_34_8]